MKRFAIFFFLFSLFATLRATEIEMPSKVTAVTVYRNMARETRSGAASLPAGNSEIVISDVSTAMIDQSIQVAVRGNAVLLSASVRNRNNSFIIQRDLSPREKKLQDSIKVIAEELNWIREERGIYEGELSLITELLKSGAKQEGYKPEDLNACADIYRKRTLELKKLLFALQAREMNLNERSNEHSEAFAKMSDAPKSPAKEIVLSFWSDNSAVVNVKAMYLVNAAGWKPMYDLNVENTSMPVNMTYKANVYQSTGSDWKSVDLTVSTSTPGMNNDRPIMSPVYVDYVTYSRAPSGTMTMAQSNAMYIPNPSNNNNQINAFEYTVNANETDIHVDYEIAIKQTIPSDGNQHICKLKDYKVPASYRYHTVPKLEAAAFLLARITDYGQYNLLAGKANVFFEETYVGQVDLNPHVTGDTLLVSLGRDERIVVKRMRIQEKVGKKILGTNIKENFAYEITVRNNKGQQIELEILDQIPLSRRKEIVVALEEKDGAAYDENSGRILWQLKIGANRSKTVKLEYTIESPEGQPVSAH